MPRISLVKLRPWKNGLAASLANPVGIVHRGPVARTVAVAVQVARAAGDVQREDPAEDDPKVATKAGRAVVAADDLLTALPKSNWRS
jgi:hypothetical protein